MSTTTIKCDSCQGPATKMMIDRDNQILGNSCKECTEKWHTMMNDIREINLTRPRSKSHVRLCA